jgi:uncharacterized protein
MTFGLREEDMDYIVSAISRFEEIEKALIFDSRAKGNNKPGSDVDIALVGENINFSIVSRLHALLEDESPMPQFFDIVDYSHLSHLKLKEHIDRVGIIIYSAKRSCSQYRIRRSVLSG